MNNLLTKANIPIINSYILVLFAFTLPITVAGANIALALMAILWIVEGDFKRKFLEIVDNKIALAMIAFVGVHIIGLLWSEDLKWGFNIVKKEAVFLVFPILLTIVRREHIKYYFMAFLMAMTLSEIISYLLWFEVIHFRGVNPINPTPFMSHSTYNPFLAFTIYLLLFFLLFDKKLSKKEKIISSIFVITMSINMFITGGRAGQIVFFVLMMVLSMQYFKKSILKTVLYAIIIIPLIVTIFYNTSTIFNQRVNETINSIQTFQQQKDTLLISSLNSRIGFNVNAFNIWMDNFLFGVGSGDFPVEYTKENANSSYKTAVETVHPHNMYLLVASELGLFGLLPFLAIFYYQFRFHLSRVDFVSPIRVALPVMFLFIMLSDSYLLGHFTTILFLFFSAIIYNNRVQIEEI